MAGPLNGVGVQTQIPLSQPYQPGNKPDVREQDNRKQDSAAVAKSYDSTSNVRENLDTRSQKLAVSVDRSNSDDSSQKRGSRLDITI